MASIREWKGSYQVRWRSPSGDMKSKSFDRKTDAREWAQSVETDKRRGHYIDPAAGRVKLAAYIDEHVAPSASRRRAGTQLKVNGHLRNHILPTFGSKGLSTILPSDVDAWIGSLEQKGLAPSTIQSVYRTFSKIMRMAVRDGRIVKSPCIEIDLPKAEQGPEMLFLTDEDVHELASSIGERYRALIYVAAYTGMRWAELVGLKVHRVNVLQREIHVAGSLAEVGGRFYEQSPKNRKTRVVPLSRSLASILNDHIAAYSSPDDYVFTAAEGGPLRRTFYRRHFKPAVARAGLDPALRFHDLRHTCAALSIDEGVNPKVIQEMLGHSSIQLTFDRYGHLMPGRAKELGDRLGERLDRAMAAQTSVGVPQ